MMPNLAAAAGRPVSRETSDRLQRYVELLTSENERQNLVAASTLHSVWQRHILDSAQLVRLMPPNACSWIDIGSGAGLPGVIVALLTDVTVTLVEPRKLRASFLDTVVEILDLSGRVRVCCAKAHAVNGSFDVVSARAVASLDKLFAMAAHLAQPRTVWILPKGKSAKSELEEARRNWHCDARIEASATDPDAAILVIRNVRAKGKA